MHVHRAHVAHVIVFPHGLQQRLAAVNLAAVGNQELKQIKLLGRQPNGLAAEHHGAVLAVDLQIVHPDDALFLMHLGLRLAAPEDGFDPRLNLQNVKRLGHVIVRAVFKPEDFIHILALGGQHDDRHIAALTDALADLDAVQPRQHHVQQNQIILTGKKLGQRFLAVHRGIGQIAVLLQTVFQSLENQGFVVHQQNLSGHVFSLLVRITAKWLRQPYCNA